MKTIALLLSVGFLGTPPVVLITVPAPGVCDTKSTYDGTKWVVECVSISCPVDCVLTQLGGTWGSPPDQYIQMGCVCPPHNGTAQCASIYAVNTTTGGVHPNPAFSGCLNPGDACDTNKVCTSQGPPPTSPTPVPPWDACECK